MVDHYGANVPQMFDKTAIQPLGDRQTFMIPSCSDAETFVVTKGGDVTLLRLIVCE